MLWVLVEFVVFLSAALLAVLVILKDPRDLKSYGLLFTVVLLGVGIARRAVALNISKSQNEYAARLAGFIDRGNELRSRKGENPLPIKEHNQWVEDMENYLRKVGKPDRVTRLSDFSGMTFFSDGSERSKFENSIDGRVRRLHEFLGEANV